MKDRFTHFTIQLSRLQKLVQKLKTDGMRRFGLKGVDTLCLYQLGQEEGLSFAQLAEACDLDPALISRTLAGLVRKGMVRKEGGKYKGSYYLTDEGKQLAAQVSAIISQVQCAADQGISPQELAVFYRVLHQLTQNMEQLTTASALFHPTDTEKKENLTI